MTLSDSKRRVLRETAVHGMGTFTAQVVSAFRGLMVAGLLGPAQYGLWKSVQVVLDCLAYTHFGVLHGMARQIPRTGREGDSQRLHRIRTTGLYAAVGTGILAGSALVVSAPLFRPDLKTVWIGIAVVLVLMQLIRYQIMTCQALGYFKVLSAADVLMACVAFLVMWLAIPSFGVLGVFVGLAAGCAAALGVGALFGVFPMPEAGCETGDGDGGRGKILRELMAYGFPFMFVDSLFVVWQRVDRIVLVAFFGAESRELGCYGLAVMAASFALQMPQVLARVLFRRTVRVFAGRNPASAEETDSLQHHLKLPCLAVAYTSPLLLGLGTLFCWFTIRLFLPEYREAEVPIAVLMVACYWGSVGLVVRNLYTATNRQWILAGIYLTAITITALLIRTGCARGLTIHGSNTATAALGMLAGSTVFAVFSLLDTSRNLLFSWRETGKLFFQTTFPFVVFGFWTIWTIHRIPTEVRETAALIQDALVQAIGCVLLNGPVLLWGVKRLVGKENVSITTAGNG